MYKYIKIGNILRSRSNKAEQQVVEKLNIVMKIKSLLTGNGLWPVFAETKL